MKGKLLIIVCAIIVLPFSNVCEATVPYEGGSYDGYSMASYAAPKITFISPDVGLPRHTIRIYGTDFGKKTETSSVIFSREPDKKEWNGKIIEWTDREITAIIPIISLTPPDAVQQICQVSVKREEGKKPSNSKTFKLLLYQGENFLVEESIILKKSGVQDQATVEHLFHIGKSLSDKDPEVEGVFGNTKLTASSIEKLKHAGFDESFIGKMEGHGQTVTLGVAAIWLWNTANLTVTPIIRIFLEPRSYFSARKPFWGGWKNFFPCGLFQGKRYDLNFGYTTITPTSKDSTLEEKSYVLAGFSFELNRSALLNLGYALVPGDAEGSERQWYVGLTIDQNFLKDIGIMKK